MKKLVCLVACLLPFSADAALNAYMKLKDARAAEVRSQVRVVSAEEAPTAAKAPRDAASGLATGKRQHKPITLTVQFDRALPLFAKLSQGAALGSVDLEVADDTRPGEREHLVDLKLDEAVVRSNEAAGDGSVRVVLSALCTNEVLQQLRRAAQP
jgi:type VI protein secretion system component Hcp